MSEPEQHIPTERRRGRFFGGIRASFLTGLVVITPIAVTAWLVWTTIGWIDGFVLPLVPGRFRPEHYIGINLRGVGVIFFFIFTIIVGWVAKGLIGRSLIGWGESVVDRMPLVRSVYNGLKQIAETVLAQTDTSFDKACLVQFPGPGLWSLGFISTTAKGELSHAIPGETDILSVFIPTTPNPTTGFLLYMPRRDVLELKMSVEDAAKLIISAGLVHPLDRSGTGTPVETVPGPAGRR